MPSWVCTIKGSGSEVLGLPSGSATDQLGDLAQVAVLEETSKMVFLYCSYLYKALYKYIIGIIITNSVLSKRLYL